MHSQLLAASPAALRGLRTTMSPRTTGSSLNSLARHAKTLTGYAALLAYLGRAAGQPITLSQATFFLLAAGADARGAAATRTELLSIHDDGMTHSIRNTYRQLLEPSLKYPQALGWLRQEENPTDIREQFLRLTDKGRAVIHGALTTTGEIA